MLVWGTTKTNYDRLIILQKHVLRILEKYKGHAKDLATEPLFLNMKSCPQKKVHNLKLMQHIHKHKLQDAFPSTVSTKYGFRRSSWKTKKICTHYGKQVIEYKAMQLLNLHESNIDLTLQSKKLKLNYQSFLLTINLIVDP